MAPGGAVVLTLVEGHYTGRGMGWRDMPYTDWDFREASARVRLWELDYPIQGRIYCAL